MAEHERHEKHETKTEQPGLGLGVGLNIDLNIGKLKSTLDMLTDSLKETGDKTTVMLSDAVRKFREMGPENIKQAKEQDQLEPGMYDRLVTNLQDAANRGEEEARSLLHDLGEKVEEGGKKVQETAEGRPEERH